MKMKGNLPVKKNKGVALKRAVFLSIVLTGPDRASFP
jgi:hypothetical protein